MISERAFAKSFPSFWQELAPLLTPRFVGLFNEAYAKELLDDSGAPAAGVPIGPGTRADVVAEFAFWAARLCHEADVPLDQLPAHAALVQEASRRALEVVQRYEGAKPAALDPLRPDELTEGYSLTLSYASLYRALLPIAKVEFAPQFLGCGFLNAADGDIGVDGTLVEVKTTTRKVAGKDLRQLITYLALDVGAGRQRWTHIGIFNPRRGTFHRAEVDALLLRVSGGKPRIDVLGDIVEFVQATEAFKDRKF